MEVDGVAIGGLLTEVSCNEFEGVAEFDVRRYLREQGAAYDVDEKFQEIFFGQVETNIGGRAICAHHLDDESMDVPILRILDHRAEIALCHFFKELEQRRSIQKAQHIVAYVRDRDQNLWVLSAENSLNPGWEIAVYMVQHIEPWAEGCLILSSESLELR